MKAYWFCFIFLNFIQSIVLGIYHSFQFFLVFSRSTLSVCKKEKEILKQNAEALEYKAEKVMNIKQ